MVESSIICEATDEKTVEETEEVQSSIETGVNLNLMFAQCFLCPTCKFNTNSEEGLQIHS